jgi:ankyrin repeat protein
MMPLHLAAEQGNVEAAKLLLEHGADVNGLEQNGWTPLQYAAGQSSKGLIDLLFTNGAVMPNTHGWTIFQIWALGAGDTNVATVLLSHGAKVNAKDSEGQTPLHFAAQQGTFQAVEWLLKNGADVNAKDDKGVTPLSLTKIRNRGREVEKRKDIADLLRKYGAKE